MKIEDYKQRSLIGDYYFIIIIKYFISIFVMAYLGDIGYVAPWEFAHYWPVVSTDSISISHFEILFGFRKKTIILKKILIYFKECICFSGLCVDENWGPQIIVASKEDY